MRRQVRPGRRVRRAFTLLEVLMVIIIIGILAALVVPNFINVGEDAKIKLTRSMIESGLNGALDLFRLHMGRYPESLDELVNKPEDEEEAEKWAGPYIDDIKKLKDAWGRELRYEYPGTYNEGKYDLSSAGPDGEFGTEDDITNWEKS